MKPGRLTPCPWMTARAPAGSGEVRELFGGERAGGHGEHSNGPRVGYRPQDDRWWLWLPCAYCGGTELPLGSRPALRGGHFELGEITSRFATRDCPACETRRRRAVLDTSAPAVWYDTLLGDWVVRLPGATANVVLPLEIGRFDASEAVVYRAASDIAHSGDALES